MQQHPSANGTWPILRSLRSSPLPSLQLPFALTRKSGTGHSSNFGPGTSTSFLKEDGLLPERALAASCLGWDLQPKQVTKCWPQQQYLFRTVKLRHEGKQDFKTACPTAARRPMSAFRDCKGAQGKASYEFFGAWFETLQWRHAESWKCRQAWFQVRSCHRRTDIHTHTHTCTHPWRERVTPTQALVQTL